MKPGVSGYHGDMRWFLVAIAALPLAACQDIHITDRNRGPADTTDEPDLQRLSLTVDVTSQDGQLLTLTNGSRVTSQTIKRYYDDNRHRPAAVLLPLTIERTSVVAQLDGFSQCPVEGLVEEHVR